jgi:hypothetical protein
MVTKAIDTCRILSLTECFTTIYWSLNYTASTMEIVLMACIIQKVCVIAFRKSSYLNGKWGWSNSEPPSQKVPSVSPPCHAKVTHLMEEFCDPTSGNCVLSGELNVRVGDINSTPVGTSNMFVKCHGKPENHKLLHDHGKITLSILVIGVAAI